MYFNDVDLSPSDRLSAGDFNDTQDCALITKRRNLKPRKVIVVTNNDNRLDIYCRTPAKFQELIDNPEANSNYRVVRYEGEQGTICNDG